MEDVQDEGRHYAIEQERAEERRGVVVGGGRCTLLRPFTSLKYLLQNGLIRLRLAAEWNVPVAGRLAAKWNTPVAAGRLAAEWIIPIAAGRLEAE